MGRGPSYPYVGLEDAIGFARRMYDYAKKGSAPVDSVITDAWKYSATSSSSVKIVAALKSYGLVEDVPGTSGKSMKLTPRSIRIILDDQDSPERREEIRKAALSPKWYEYCWKTWGKEMPPSMKSNLLIEHGFVDSTVESFLRDYRKTVSYAGLLDSQDPAMAPESTTSAAKALSVGDYVQWESQGLLRMPAAKKLTHFSPDGGFAFVEGSLTGIPVAELIAGEAPEEGESSQNIPRTPVFKTTSAGGVKMQTETFALPEGVTGQLQWPTEMSAEAYEDFIYQLEGLKRRVNRAVKKSAEVPSQDEG